MTIPSTTPVLLFSCVLCFSIYSDGAELPNLTCEDAVNHCLTYREENFDLGHVRLTALDTSYNDRYPTTLRQYDVWVSGDSIRQDQILLRLAGNNKNKNGGDWDQIAQTLWASGKCVRRHGKDRNLAVVISKQEQPYGWREERMFHPRSLGMGPQGIKDLFFRGTRSLLYVGNPSWKFASMCDVDQINGHETYRIKIDVENANGGMEANIWVRPDQGYGVVRAQTSQVFKDGLHFLHTTDTSLVKYGNKGLWYPEKCEFKFVRDGQLVEKQLVIVEEASFDSAPVAGVFTLSGIGLSAGQAIVDYTAPQEGGLVWDGSNVVSLAAFDNILDISPISRNRNLFLWANAIVCAFLAALIIRRIYVSRRAN